MFGIGTKPARFLAAAILAIGVGAVGLPVTAEAGDGHRRHGGHKFHGHFKQKHFGHKNFGRGHFKQRHFRRHHGHHFHGHRRHHHGGFGIHIWRPFPKHHLMSSACHPVVGHGFDAFGRRAKFGGTMCYDRFGNGYVVAGSQHVIHYF